jgi:hypothetical protein
MCLLAVSDPKWIEYQVAVLTNVDDDILSGVLSNSRLVVRSAADTLLDRGWLKVPGGLGPFMIVVFAATLLSTSFY